MSEENANLTQELSHHNEPAISAREPPQKQSIPQGISTNNQSQESPQESSAGQGIISTNYPVITNISQINRSRVTNTDVVEIEVPSSNETVQIKSYTSLNSLPGASYRPTPSSQFSTMAVTDQHQNMPNLEHSSSIHCNMNEKSRKPTTLPQTSLYDNNTKQNQIYQQQTPNDGSPNQQPHQTHQLRSPIYKEQLSFPQTPQMNTQRNYQMPPTPTTPLTPTPFINNDDVIANSPYYNDKYMTSELAMTARAYELQLLRHQEQLYEEACQMNRIKFYNDFQQQGYVPPQYANLNSHSTPNTHLQSPTSSSSQHTFHYGGQRSPSVAHQQKLQRAMEKQKKTQQRQQRKNRSVLDPSHIQNGIVPSTTQGHRNQQQQKEHEKLYMERLEKQRQEQIKLYHRIQYQQYQQHQRYLQQQQVQHNNYNQQPTQQNPGSPSTYQPPNSMMLSPPLTPTHPASYQPAFQTDNYHQSVPSPSVNRHHPYSPAASSSTRSDQISHRPQFQCQSYPTPTTELENSSFDFSHLSPTTQYEMKRISRHNVISKLRHIQEVKQQKQLHQEKMERLDRLDRALRFQEEKQLRQITPNALNQHPADTLTAFQLASPDSGRGSIEDLNDCKASDENNNEIDFHFETNSAPLLDVDKTGPVDPTNACPGIKLAEQKCLIKPAGNRCHTKLQAWRSRMDDEATEGAGDESNENTGMGEKVNTHDNPYLDAPSPGNLVIDE
eukprot:TCONS_00029693-protein